MQKMQNLMDGRRFGLELHSWINRAQKWTIFDEAAKNNALDLVCRAALLGPHLTDTMRDPFPNASDRQPKERVRVFFRLYNIADGSASERRVRVIIVQSAQKHPSLPFTFVSPSNNNAITAARKTWIREFTLGRIHFVRIYNNKQKILRHHRCKEQGRAALHQAILEQHDHAREQWREARAKAQRERLKALKSQDMERYAALVLSGQDPDQHPTLRALLQQTEVCLQKLLDRLKLHTSSLSFQYSESNESCAMSNSEMWTALAANLKPKQNIDAQPSLLNPTKQLREYQMAGLRWMVALRDHNLNGILADDMGLGKTVQVIALVAYSLSLASAARCDDGTRNPTYFSPILIAAPASVLPNWEREFREWAPQVKVITYRGAAPIREQVWHHSRKTPFHVLLTTYDYLMGSTDMKRLSSIWWHYIIVDEGHRLKNASCALNAALKKGGYRSQHRLLLTGTPIHNGLDELWSLLNFLMPEIFDSADDFMTWFHSEQPKTSRSRCPPRASDPRDDPHPDEQEHAKLLSEEEILIVTTRLHQVLRPFVLRRLKESVATELPTKIERVLTCNPSPYQLGIFKVMQSTLDMHGTIRGVSNLFMEYRAVVNHPTLSRLHQQGCELTAASMHSSSHPLPPELRLCGKMELLDRVLLKLAATNHRILIFCTMTKLLDVMEEYMEWRGWCYVRLDGGTNAQERGALVDQFNAPYSPHFAFLLSIRAGGEGLNLQGADTVIFYDTDFNPQMDAQAAARAHRLGQTKDVLVLRLQTKGTVEDRVLEISTNKRHLAERSITGGGFDGTSTTPAERRRLLMSILAKQRTMLDQGSNHQGDVRENEGESDGDHHQEADDDSDESELNQLLARSKDELTVFGHVDRRRREAERQAWIEAHHGSPPTRYQRLAHEQEVRDMVDLASAAAAPKRPFAPEELGFDSYGRGKRLRSTQPLMYKEC